MKTKLFTTVFYIILSPIFSFSQTSWKCEILSAERQVTIDETSGANILFLTTSQANDHNLYFHDRCWLTDESMMLFFSDRSGRNEVYGYVDKTGELVRLNRPRDNPAIRPIASRQGNNVYVVRGRTIYRWRVDIIKIPSLAVKVTETRICALPEVATQVSGLNESCDAKWLSYGYKLDDSERNYIAVVNIDTGESQVVAEMDFPIQHIQFSWTRPTLLSFARGYGNDTAPLDPKEPAHARIWFINTDTKVYTPAFYQKPGELATHECWWVNDLMTFCGGHRPGESHVKELDFRSGEIRIIGAGAWWDTGTARELAKVNWWHAAGSPDGRWVVADNWHGVIALFDAKTTEMKILTQGHRTYGSGAHPHVGWDLKGKRVEFTSNKLGNPDVCIGFIPNNW